MVNAIVVATVCFVLFLATHIIVFHKTDVRRKFRTMLFIAIAFCLLGCGLILFISGGTLQIQLSNTSARYLLYLGILLFYFSLSYCYFHTVVVIDRSISVRLLVEIASARDKGLTEQEIRKRYSVRGKFRDELRDLVFLKRVTEDKGVYKNTAQGQRHARIVSFLRSYLNLSTHR